MVYFLWNAIPWIQNLQENFKKYPVSLSNKKLSKFLKHFTTLFSSYSIIANQYHKISELILSINFKPSSKERKKEKNRNNS